MSLNIRLPRDPGPRVKELADRLRAIANDRTNQYSDQDLRDAAISGLISIVAELERDVAAINKAAEAARTQATFDELQRRSYDTGR
ncbi:hypothetical protein A5675_11030 [Mycobacterium malmoense]|uniref:hypothetical protein n=1 Tax=Mycobacterium malmoense TaxID=1780 RepID=UPI00080B1015|nr:hypothetical protein [Mycobacterium malmoense]OCB41046.1 hypothetical protein A5675_11030 [Mycobacterium malmoense]